MKWEGDATGRALLGGSAIPDLHQLRTKARELHQAHLIFFPCVTFSELLPDSPGHRAEVDAIIGSEPSLASTK